MSKFQFARTVNVDGTLYSAGDVINEGDIGAGYFESCVRVGHLVAVADQPDPAEVFAATMGSGIAAFDAAIAAPPDAEPPSEILTLDPPAPAPAPESAQEPTPSGPLVGPPGDPQPESNPEPKPADSKSKRK